mmetsp:Transcript_12903/g.27381  ORF Transcript_12903/g.27381 Transcript_12903/m.27381 type:complete len:218 (-) Transcript_12903:243-896(-)
MGAHSPDPANQFEEEQQAEERLADTRCASEKYLPIAFKRFKHFAHELLVALPLEDPAIGYFLAERHDCIIFLDELEDFRVVRERNGFREADGLELLSFSLGAEVVGHSAAASLSSCSHSVLFGAARECGHVHEEGLVVCGGDALHFCIRPQVLVALACRRHIEERSFNSRETDRKLHLHRIAQVGQITLIILQRDLVSAPYVLSSSQQLHPHLDCHL